MYRSILTGTLIFAFSAGGIGIAAADQMPAPTPIAANTASADPAAPAPPADGSQSSGLADTSDATARGESSDAAPPTAGADLAMWNVAPAASIQFQPASERVKPIVRLRRFASGIVSRSTAIASSLTRSAMRFIGTPYVFGGTHTNGFDCSGYVQHVFAMLGMRLPRTADAQYDAGRHVAASMEPGDLVFFHTYAPGVSHVGIYLGNDKFIHSSSSHGVAITSLHNRYWAPRYLGAKRIFGS